VDNRWHWTSGNQETAPLTLQNSKLCVNCEVSMQLPQLEFVEATYPLMGQSYGKQRMLWSSVPKVSVKGGIEEQYNDL
jgi:hypothetical protein